MKTITFPDCFADLDAVSRAVFLARFPKEIRSVFRIVLDRTLHYVTLKFHEKTE